MGVFRFTYPYLVILPVYQCIHRRVRSEGGSSEQPLAERVWGVVQVVAPPRLASSPKSPWASDAWLLSLSPPNSGKRRAAHWTLRARRWSETAPAHNPVEWAPAPSGVGSRPSRYWDLHLAIRRAKTPTSEEEEAKDLEVDMDKTEDALQLWTTHRDGEILLRLTKHGPGHETPITIPEFFRESVSRFGTYPAVATRKNDKWEFLKYSQYYEACRKAARGFLKLGLERFNAVGILGFNSVEWFIAGIGAILAGGLCVGIYVTNSPEACQYAITNAKVNILVVENDQQLRKILSIPQEKLETLKAIVQYKPPMKESGSNVYSWDDFMELGNSIPDSQLDEIIESQKANQCAVIIYTSGTTGNPKGVMLSHDNITWMAGAVSRNCNLSLPPEKQEMVVSYLPLSHIAAQIMDMWIPIKVGAITYFAQPDALRGTLVNTLHQVRPTSFLGVPRIWEKMQEKIKENSTKSSALKKKVFSWARNIGLQVNTKRMLGVHDPPMSYHMAKALVFSKVRSALGLDRCRYFVCGAAPLPEETAEFFLSLDIPICEMYGMSESSGPHTVSVSENYRILSCGKPLSGSKTMLSQQNKDGIGELCLWGRHVFMGYLDREDATREAIDEDGWLHSGDLGRMDKHGYIYITGRTKEILITAGGENVAPVPIENLVKQRIPIISNAMLVGDKAKFLSILLTLKCEFNSKSGEPLDRLSPETINFCRHLGSQSTTVTDILEGQDPYVYTAIQKGIDKVNEAAISNAQKIQKWLILEKDFSISSGELGPTGKVRRQFITEKYKTQISNLYH
ncbi:long-chain-fatty-acid--CoA ligase ACSBG2 [Orycteropus afer afer]|uniref:Long-chain-fatty-acid--CoA ligase ACSBG2 n=1 Tax=Orycteropus afer afer TaxID=1230840 RepID=A0A8B7AXL5_ORYAF|nr:long-chain-fatty-acid--CoA ligase ACSBG2 [Orycteropus afer afer]